MSDDARQPTRTIGIDRVDNVVAGEGNPAVSSEGVNRLIPDGCDETNDCGDCEQ